MTADTPSFNVVRDPARLAALRALSLEEGHADEAFDRLTRLAVHALGAQAALVNIVGADKQVTRSAYGSPEEYHAGDEAVLGNSMCALAVEEGAPVVIPDTGRDLRVSDMNCVAGGIGAYAGVPLTLKSGHSLGALCVVSGRAREWTQSELQLLSDLARSATAELELLAANRDAEERAQAEKSASRLRAIQRVSDVALNHATLDESLDAILQVVREILRADVAAVFLADPANESLEARSTIGLMGDGWEIVMPFGVGVAGRIAERREAMIVQDLAAANAHEAFLRSGVKSLMGTPLLHNDELLGVIQVGTRESTQFEEGDLRLLEHAARRIAIAIDRARLFDAQREALVAAEAASRAKSAFLAVMSHELRTPLNAIAGFAQLLEEGAMGPLNAEQKQMLGRVTASAKHLSSIINDMLQYVEIERHPPQLVADGDSLDAILERIVQRARSASERAGVTIVRQAGGAGKVRVPAVPAEDILRRLLDNAIKFSPMGGSVTISDDIAGDNVRLTIADSGPGIPQDRREQVFAAFGRVDSSYTRAQDGAGMGLPLARARARQVGGDIVIDGEGPGARLVITLPRMG